MSLILTTPTNPGTATWTDAADLLTASTFVLDVSAATETANVYNNLDSLAAAVAQVRGPKVVQFAIPAVLSPLPGPVSGIVVPNGANGPYDFSDCSFVTTLGAYSTLPIDIDFADGVVFSGMPYRFAGQGVGWRFPAGFWTPTATFNVINVDGPVLFSKPGLVGAGCFIVGDNIYVFVYTGSLGAVSGWGDGTEGLFEISALGYVQVSLYDQGQVGNKTASGPGYLQVVMGDANCTCNLQTLLTGTLDIASNEHGTIVYDTTSPSSYNFIYPSWAVVYSIARNLGLNRDQIVHVNGTAGVIPASGTSWDLSNIILTGNPGSILTIADGTDLSSTTQLRVSGGLTLRVAAGSLTSPIIWSNATSRTIQINDSAVIENLASVPFIAASGTSAIRASASGSRYVPCSTGGTFISANGTATIDLALARPSQGNITLPSATVNLTVTSEMEQKATCGPSPAQAYLADGLTNAFVRIPQYSTVLLRGTITARGVLNGTANAGTWTFTTMVTRDGAGSTIITGATATAVQAVNYATLPVWVLDAGSGGVRLQVVGPNTGVSSQWTMSLTMTATGTGA